MDIRKAILATHSRKQADKIVKYVGNDPERFGVLMDIILKNEKEYVARAAWPMTYCVEAHPELVKPWLGKLIKNLDKPGKHGAVARSTVRFFHLIEIPKKFHGAVMDKCFAFIQSNDTLPATKAFALMALQKMVDTYPEILPELKMILEDRWAIETGAVSRGRKKYCAYDCQLC